MRNLVLVAAGLCCTTLPLAQPTTDAVTAERMERAKRDASNPLRIIIEASQVKRTRAAEAPAAAAPAAAPAAARAEARPAPDRRAPRPTDPVVAQSGNSRTATTPAASSAEAAPSTASATATAGSLGGAADRESSGTASPGAPAATASSAMAPEPGLTSAGISAATGAASVLPAGAGLAAAAAPSATVPNPAQPAAEVLAPLKLVRYVEPDIPARLRARLGRSSEVTVALKVQRDGSVSDVGIRSTTARVLDPAVLDAVKQWRYDPVPEARDHLVQLVFKLGE